MERYVVEVLIFRHMNAPEEVGNPAALREAETEDDPEYGRAGFSRPSATPPDGVPPATTPTTDNGPSAVVLQPVPPDPEPAPLEPLPEESEPTLVYEPVPEGEFMLAEMEERMRNLGAYEPLLHVAWIQEPYPATLAPAFRVDETYTARPDLTGTITFSHGRFPHLEMDLSYRPETLAFQYPDWAGYQLHEYRRMRDGEDHYFDNAHFGVVARVTPYEPEETELPGVGPEEPLSAPR